ncbi:hypothetical protein D3C72_2417360 [compost metagenome]
MRNTTATKPRTSIEQVQLTNKLKNLAGFMDVLVQIDLANKHKHSKQTEMIIQRKISIEGNSHE